MAQEDLIPINPVIVDVVRGSCCCQPFWFQLSPSEWYFGMKSSSSQMEWCFQFEDIKIFSNPWQGALWGIMTNLPTKRKFLKLQKQMERLTCQLERQKILADPKAPARSKENGSRGRWGEGEEEGARD